MCGIVGAAARRDVVPVLLEGLRRRPLSFVDRDMQVVAVAPGDALLRSITFRVAQFRRGHAGSCLTERAYTSERAIASFRSRNTRLYVVAA